MREGLSRMLVVGLQLVMEGDDLLYIEDEEKEDVSRRRSWDLLLCMRLLSEACT